MGISLWKCKERRVPKFLGPEIAGLMLAKVNCLVLYSLSWNQWPQSIYGKPSDFVSWLSAIPRESHGHRAVQLALILKIMVYSLDITLYNLQSGGQQCHRERRSVLCCPGGEGNGAPEQAL